MKRARTILSVLALFVAAGIQTAVAEISSAPSWYIDGTEQYEQLFYISSAGDVNGDGYEDVVVGNQWRYGGIGHVSLYYGSSSGLSTTPAWTVANDQESSAFGHATGIGDVNGDGYGDVLVSAHQYSNGQINEGRAYVYYGSATGLKPSADWMIESNQPGALLGFRPMNISGDLNKDGYDDVIIASCGYNNDTGQASIYYGSAAGLSTTPGWTVTGDQVGGSFGFASCIAGDVNGDGWLDVIIGTGYYNNGLPNAGRVYVYYGSASGLSTTPNLIIEGKQAGGNFGDRVAPAGDVNGDGYDDIIVGAYWYNNGVPQEGAAFVYYGSATGLNANNYSIVSTGVAGASVGWVNKVGDVNNDGYDDVIIGSPWYDGMRGKAFIYLGSKNGLNTT
ncbi:MAG: FG-GAP-like repeat-containing protein, partial [Proteobacteria bacterium]|nr:FG-GAP-like repeat-containing protein [Pseudomonadota bacterium]